ncbi:pogo transposable element, putative [Talaromyces stipitatus ATCC 10500]|uniref:Pogo transposable element, putative n=1 Tax=Talaromyces stipitatus (strain ATCC 10500 / CBS 375.48 / QM 6759 / NRRL 1006) TaxID=441959 RepID=B8M202_TALSN|nr:pogo transposable element, putative [Talaromyces stipitatus ATCC 10500]EED21380.1 pogo transposable element, putative [Talaromyces stipitatus ATCC 10500]
MMLGSAGFVDSVTATTIELTLTEKVKKYRISPSNTYNFDEKGFNIGLCRTEKRIVSKSQLCLKKLLGAIQDGSTEFITLIACICANGIAIPPALIYQGESGDLQDTWLKDFDGSREKAYFATSEKGWTNEELGFSWLTKIFDPHTKAKAGNSKRLLLTDGHSSHVNLRFIEYCDRNNIILGILPPHSTHRLQPLDVGIFPPLAGAYSHEIDRLTQSSSGFSRITKASFWRLFYAAWKSTLTLQNIRSAFAAPGIHPFNPPKVLNILKKKTPSPISSDIENKRKSPGSVRAIRRTLKAIRQEKSDLSEATQLALKALQKYAVQNEILEHQQQGLVDALIGEKKRQKRGRPLGLINKDNPGEAQFFSPGRIEAARQQIQNIELQKEQGKIEAANRRTQKAFARQQKAQEIQERRETRIREREEKRRQKELEKEQLRVAREAQKEVKRAKERPAKQVNTKKRRYSKVIESNEEVSSKRPKTGISRSGRAINLPIRFRD